MCVSRMVWNNHRQLQLELVTYFCTYIYSTIIPTLHADSVPPPTQMCVSRMVRNNHRQLQLELVTYICTYIYSNIIPTLHADSVPPPTHMCVSRMVWNSHRQLQFELVITLICTCCKTSATEPEPVSKKRKEDIDIKHASNSTMIMICK